MRFVLNQIKVNEKPKEMNELVHLLKGVEV